MITLAELKAYVDRNWPSGKTSDNESGNESQQDWGLCDTQTIAAEIRYLLARCMTRLNLNREAIPYFTHTMRWCAEAHARAMESGRDRSKPPIERAESLWEAAKITRYYGMALMGTAVEPDWHLLWRGDYSLDSIGAIRLHPTTNAPPDSAEDPEPSRPTFELVPATEIERSRVSRTEVAPDERFHYRRIAAELAWEAAQLLPDESDATAQVLCEAGSWFKVRDPKYADRFYKALVRRCRHTELGEEAERRRWFPELEEREMPSTVH